MSGLPDDWVERTTAAVRATPVPAMPPGLMRAVAKGVMAEVKASRRRRIMRYATVCGLVVCLAASAWLVGAGGSAQASLLQALKKQEAKSYKAVQRTETADGKLVPNSNTTSYFSGGKLRTEYANGSYAVADWATRTFAVIDPAAKTVLTHQVEKEVVLTGRDPYSMMMSGLPEALAIKDRIDDLGIQVVGNRRLKGHRYRGELVGLVQPSSTFWLDPKDQMLVRYECYNVPQLFRATRGEDGKTVSTPILTDVRREPTTTVFEFSEFGAEFDAKLFDATPPAGYKVSKLE